MCSVGKTARLNLLECMDWPHIGSPDLPPNGSVDSFSHQTPCVGAYQFNSTKSNAVWLDNF